jgi:histidyl-tRNA synthetase
MQSLVEGAPRLMDDLDEASLAHFDAVQKNLSELGIAYRINTRLVRGLDYYNRTVFEWVTDKLGAQGTVCAGGRYDGLIEQLGGKSSPACGFAMGIERLLALLEAEGVEPAICGPHAYLVHAGEAAQAWAWQVARGLREKGAAVVMHTGGGSFKSQMKKADASGARFAVIIGDNEAAEKKLVLKPLRDAAEQATLNLEEAADILLGKN